MASSRSFTASPRWEMRRSTLLGHREEPGDLVQRGQVPEQAVDPKAAAEHPGHDVAPCRVEVVGHAGEADANVTELHHRVGVGPDGDVAAILEGAVNQQAAALEVE